jgi:hypothetical protein
VTDSATHPWFGSTAGIAVTSHNGSSSRASTLGTRTSFRKAYRAGYRWFQVDALPIKGDLLSRHAIFGRSLRYSGKTREQLARLLPDVPTLYELLTDPELAGSNWNIELKSRKGLPALLELIGRLHSEGFDVRRLLISSPVRPAVVKGVANAFPTVALAAPFVHGGVFGVRFLGSGRARTSVGAYHCQQVWSPLVRVGRGPVERLRRRIGASPPPLRQAWTIGNRSTLDRVLRAGAQPIVTSHALTIRRSLAGQPPLPTSTPVDLAKEVTAQLYQAPEALALGGGGWRGAFGGIGAVMYFTHRKMFEGIHDIVGISGGSFTVAALAREQPPDPTDDPEPQVVAMRQLLRALEGAGRQTLSILGIVVTGLVAVAGVAGVVMLSAWHGQSNGVTPWLIPLLLVSSFLIRAAVSLRWKLILKGVYGSAPMVRVGPDVDRSAPCRRYAIGATGLSDGYLYSFTSDPEHDVNRWRQDRTLATPLGGHRLADVVARATSLPGLGQLGVGRIWLPTCDHDRHRRRDRHQCDNIPDRLVDGGVSGIFGRGLIQARARGPQKPEPTEVVVVDAGRSLAVERRSLGNRVARLGQRSSALMLLSRWLKVAMDVSYREELKYVRDGNVVDAHRFRLVRLAEEEDPFDAVTGTVRNASKISLHRRDDLNRLYVLRDQVHQFSLMRVNRTNANRTIVVAVAACALEFEHEPDIPAMLEAIGVRLGRGRQLTDVWHGVRVPLLGEPLQLGPPEVRSPQPLDHRPAAFEVSIGGV